MKSKFSIIFLIVLLFSGCATKEVVKYKYIYKPMPKLKTYEYNKTFDFGSVYNKNDLVCIEKWNVCIKKKYFKDLVIKIIELKNTNKKLNEEIREYNKYISKDVN